MFSAKRLEKLDHLMDEFAATFDGYIARSERKSRKLGYCMAIANCCAVVGYGREETPP